MSKKVIRLLLSLVFVMVVFVSCPEPSNDPPKAFDSTGQWRGCQGDESTKQMEFIIDINNTVPNFFIFIPVTKAAEEGGIVLDEKAHTITITASADNDLKYDYDKRTEGDYVVIDLKDGEEIWYRIINEDEIECTLKTDGVDDSKMTLTRIEPPYKIILTN